MMLDFTKELHDIQKLLADPDTQPIDVAAVLAQVFDNGMSFERNRCIDIVQKLSMNAPTVVAAIRRPMR